MLGVFPEGTRGSGDVSHAEQGAAWLVRSTGAVVLPIATRGTLRPSGSGRRLRPKLDVLVGEPFPLTVARGRSGLGEATEEIRRRLADLVHELDEQRTAAV
jgi:1-acyl-sn-glycerol-3-phosphate acyltransferase